MDSAQRFWAQVLATLGSGLLLVSLWLHWYSFRIPDSAISQAEHLAGQFGILGPYVDAAAQVVRRAGTLHLDAWQAFGQIDVALAVCGSMAALLAGLTVTGRASGAGRLMAWIGTAAAVLCLYRTVSPPGPSGLLHAAFGAYLALAAAVALVVGGTLLDREPEVMMAAPPPYGATPVVTGSVRTAGHVGAVAAATVSASSPAAAPTRPEPTDNPTHRRFPCPFSIVKRCRPARSPISIPSPQS